MAIATSAVIADQLQADGRRYVTERHTDHLGAHHDVTYLAESGANAQTPLSARAAQIVENLRHAEIQANMAKALSAELTFTFNHSTVAQNRAALRELFKIATKWELMTLGWVIFELNLTDNQLKNLFEVNDAQLPALKTRITNIADKYEEALELSGQ